MQSSTRLKSLRAEPLEWDLPNLTWLLTGSMPVKLFASSSPILRRLVSLSSPQHHRTFSKRMGKNRSKAPAIPESCFNLPAHNSFKSEGAAPNFVDTHTHLLSTFTSYRSKYPEGQYSTLHDFARGLYRPLSGKHAVSAMVDVWCDAPVVKQWKEVADSALTEEQRDKDWGGLEYWFVMGEFSTFDQPTSTQVFVLLRRTSVSRFTSEHLPLILLLLVTTQKTTTTLSRRRCKSFKDQQSVI